MDLNITETWPTGVKTYQWFIVDKVKADVVDGPIEKYTAITFGTDGIRKYIPSGGSIDIEAA